MNSKYILCFEILAKSKTLFCKYKCSHWYFCSKMFTIVAYVYKRFDDELPKQ